MNANEFRIGNLVIDNLTKEILVCCGTHCDTNGTNTKIDFSVINREKYHLPNGWEAEPIAITEEWLLKFGFEKEKRNRFYSYYLNNDDENEYSRQRIDYWFGEDNFCAAELCRAGVCFKRVKLKYVHQIQNLYFALTNEELTIKNG